VDRECGNDDAAGRLTNPETFRGDAAMLYWALVCFIIAIIAGLFGFGVLAEGFETIGMVLFVVFLVLFVISLVAGRRPVA
jgi:uncharacterized membrane protein YtjA (UPF0391 family)